MPKKAVFRFFVSSLISGQLASNTVRSRVDAASTNASWGERLEGVGIIVRNRLSVILADNRFVDNRPLNGRYDLLSLLMECHYNFSKSEARPPTLAEM